MLSGFYNIFVWKSFLKLLILKILKTSASMKTRHSAQELQKNDIVSKLKNLKIDL